MNYRYTKTHLFAVLAGLSLYNMVSSHGEERSITNALGWADRWGNLSVWFNFDKDVNLDDQGVNKLPLRLQYSSKQRFIGEGAAGAGWWFPLLESTVSEMNERSVKLHTVNGNTETLIQDSKNPLLYSTKDLQWTGERQGSKFVVTTYKKWRYEYDGGRLRSATTPEGDLLRWDYERNKAISIKSRQLGPLLTADYDSETGLIQKINFNKGDAITFKSGQRPDAVILQGQMLVANMSPSIVGMTTTDGYVMDAVAEPLLEDKLMKLALTEKDGAKLPTSRTFLWEPGSGVLSHDGEFKYTVTPNGNGDEIFPLLERINSKGQKESYHMDRKKMEAVHRKLDGSITSYQYVGSPGLSFGKLRKSVKSLPSGSSNEDQDVTTEQFFYAAEGYLMRHVVNGKAAFQKGIQHLPNGMIEKQYRLIRDHGPLSLYLTRYIENNLITREDYFDGSSIIYKNGKPSVAITALDEKVSIESPWIPLELRKK